MLAPSRSGAYICLRCQSHSAGRRALAAAAFQHARFLSQSRWHLEEVETSPAPETKKKRDRRIYPHVKLRGKKGGELRESSELLPVNALGKPAEIILLKDADLDRTKEEGGDRGEPAPTGPPTPQRKSSKKAILDAVAKGSVAVDPQSTLRSVEELRDTVLKRIPPKGDHITQEEHDKLVKALSEGFRTVQLRQYATQKGRNLLMRTVRQTKNLPHSDWTPGTTPSDEKHLILTSNVGRTHISKEKLARTIIERGWQLHIDRPMQVGEIDVYDASSFIQARDEYGSLIVDQIAETRHVKMQILTEKVLRITGDKEAAMAALGDISEKCLTVLKEQIRLITVKKKPVPKTAASKDSSAKPATVEATHRVSLVARNDIKAADINVLRSTTGVLAKFAGDKNLDLQTAIKTGSPVNLKISGHSKGQMADAFRALYSMANLATRTRHHAITMPAKSSSVNGPVPHPSTLPYHERNTDWHRTVSSLSKTLESGGSVSIKSGAISKLVASVQAATQSTDDTDGQTEKKTSEERLIWDLPSTTRFTTHLGFVFSNASTPTAENAFQPSGLFVPGLVHHSPLLSYLSNTSAVAESTRNIISFIYRHDPPVSSTGSSQKARKKLAAKAKGFLPEIRFDFMLAAQKGEPPVLDGVRATVKDDLYSVALPDKPIDFSVLEKCVPKFRMGNEETSQVFSSDIEGMIASIKSDARLRAQTTLDVPIPRSWTSSPHGQQLGLWGTEPFKLSHLKAQYRFVGVEHKQTVSFEREGRAYEFTTVEGGKLGATYAELSVIGDEAGDDTGVMEKEREQGLRKAFKAGFEMVDLVGRASKGLLTFGDAKGGDVVDEEGPEVTVEEQSQAMVLLEEKNLEGEEHLLEHGEDQRFAASG